MKHMKSIQTSLHKWIEQNKQFKERHEQMKREVLAHPHVVKFLQAHPNIPEATIEKRLNRLYEYTLQSLDCAKCKNYESCINVVKGHTPTLQYINGDIRLVYKKCSSLLHFEQLVQKRKLIKSIHMPKEIVHASLQNIYLDPNRADAMKLIDQFIHAAKTQLPKRGIYFAGPFGVGKTYFLGAIANELQDLNISTTLIYMPEFVREMNAAIQDNTVQEKIELFKTAQVLMLDDIGAETMSAWFRDEVLGAILQYRMMENLPVFFTSNYTMDQLEEVLATSSKGGIERVKAGRIMERIRQVSQEVFVGGENRRQ